MGRVKQLKIGEDSMITTQHEKAEWEKGRRDAHKGYNYSEDVSIIYRAGWRHGVIERLQDTLNKGGK